MRLTQKRLKELMHYDTEKGEFIWLVNASARVKVGEVVGGSDCNGYIQVGIDGKRYRAHRLAFLYMEGYFPEHSVDHKNGVVWDNRWDNLRHSSQRCNMQNTKVSKNNTSGFPGVVWHKDTKKWEARAFMSGKDIHLDHYVNPLDAALARLTWEVQCPQWKCNHRSELVKLIKKFWPEFNLRSVENG